MAVLESPRAVLEYYLPVAAGTYSSLSARLLERAHARMAQAGCSTAVLEAVAAIAAKVGRVE